MIRETLIAAALALVCSINLSAQVTTRPDVIGVSSGGGPPNLVAVDANTIAERNGATPQSFWWSKSFTDTLNQQFLRLQYDANAGGASVPGYAIGPRAITGGVDAPAGDRVVIAADAIRLIGKDLNGNYFVDLVLNELAGEKYVQFSQLPIAKLSNGDRLAMIMPMQDRLCWTDPASGVFGPTPDAVTTLCIRQAEQSVALLGVANNATAPDGTAGKLGTWQAGDPGYSKPACQASRRGMYWHTFGGAGVKDTVEVCAKDILDAYAWRTIY